MNQQEHSLSAARPRWAKTAISVALSNALPALGVAALAFGLYVWNDNRLKLAPTVVLPLKGEMRTGGQIDADRLVPTLAAACQSDQVETVVLQLDSPGGSPAIADRVVDTLDSLCGDKRVLAVVENLCGSACYAIAVAADEIIATRSSAVGSIGAIMRWKDYSGALAAAGIEDRAIVSGPLKGALGDTGNLTPGQQADMQALVNELGGEFVDEVRLRRGERLDPAAPIQDGGLFAARRAKTLGLIDRVATLETVLREVAPDGDLTFAPATRVGHPGTKSEGRGERLAREAIERARQAVSP